MTYNKECDWCGKKFKANRKDKRFCSSNHKNYHHVYKNLVVEARNIIKKHFDGDEENAYNTSKELNRLMEKAVAYTEKYKSRIDIKI